jgi:hypothetical protein
MLCRVPAAWDPDVELESVVQEVKKKVGPAFTTLN